MRRRLFALLVVALVSGIVAGTVASAIGRLDTMGARIPALPALREVANTCPVPPPYRQAFVRAGRVTGLPLAMLVAVGQVESNLRADARFHSSDLALAAYNAGPTAVAAAAGAPTGETAAYVANVTALWRELRGCR